MGRRERKSARERERKKEGEEKEKRKQNEHRGWKGKKNSMYRRHRRQQRIGPLRRMAALTRSRTLSLGRGAERSRRPARATPETAEANALPKRHVGGVLLGGRAAAARGEGGSPI